MRLFAAAGLTLLGGACTSEAAPDAAPVSDVPLRAACAAAREARDDIVALQNGEELTPESNRRLSEKLDKISEEASRSRNEDLDPLARDAQLAQKTSAEESMPVPVRHEAFHTVVKRVGRIFTECKDAGTPMPGVSPTIPPQAQ